MLLRFQPIFRIVSLVTAGLIAGCSGGGDSGTTPQPVASTAPADLVPVTLTIKWPKSSSENATRARSSRSPKYL